MVRGLSKAEIGDSHLCKRCLDAQVIRKAWTVRDGDAACLLHAELGPDGDDMRQREHYEVIYEKLRLLGYDEAF